MTHIIHTPADLQAFIEQHHIDATLIGGLGDTPTVPAAAAALGVEPTQIVKTLLFLIAGPGAPEALRPVVVISHGQKRVDKGLVAAHWGAGKKRVNLAPPDTVVELLGYPAGGVPPFGHRAALPVLVDASLLELRNHAGGIIYGGGGDDRTMMRLTVDELLRVTGGEVVRVSGEAGD